MLLLHNDDPAWTPSEAAEAARAVDQLAGGLRAEGHPVIPVPVRDEDLAGALGGYCPQDHVVVNWCEELPGVPRSEAQVAGMLERLGFAYTGSPAEVLERCWDRRRVKARLERFGIPTPRWRCWDGEAPVLEPWERFPAIVKPAREHCSVGISRESVVLDRGELAERVAFVREAFGQPALVEEFIDGRELHVTAWGNGSIDVLPAAEMDFSYFTDVRDRLCTFDSKFTPGSAHYEKIELRVPAPLSGHERLGVEQVVRRAYRAFGCRDYARVDLRLLGRACLVLDVNPNADLSPDTSLAYTAEVAGVSCGKFASGLVNLAAQRHPAFRGEAGGG
ncbi:MAG: D-alanine--D-alanine ligase family protein [Deferrisomatales bacterium]